MKPKKGIADKIFLYEDVQLKLLTINTDFGYNPQSTSTHKVDCDNVKISGCISLYGSATLGTILH